MNARKIALPSDVRLMNATSTALLALAAVLLCTALVVVAARHPAFALAAVVVKGDLRHHNEATLKASVLPKLSGTVLTMDLAQARQAFQTLPWIRHATVQRQFPNRLAVSLQEHVPAARWGDSDAGFVNQQGEVFDATADSDEAETMPRLAGPHADSASVLALYQRLNVVFASVQMPLQSLELSPLGAWHATLDSGADIQLGRGSVPEVEQRALRFVRTMTQVAAQHGRSPQALTGADLRHPDGYALRLKGVTTTDDADKADNHKG